ncbi:hypothetical protein M9H77_19269 [Catharanthus roseus]|uniref:Uncharacterized protein n=1 Tax=Catharanthus roseus TaxID=4058 RepID=A0ACC0B9U9_CATRO|nr:hypothetical protein M9H77_19269 [Catharanthus roseus]
MGRKIEMKKIKDIKKSQVTFSKRRSSLIKKAEQIAITCDVDVAFLAFSSSGRVSHYCSRERLDEVLNRYANLPVEKRLRYLLFEKMKKLQELIGNNKDEDELLSNLNNQLSFSILSSNMNLCTSIPFSNLNRSPTLLLFFFFPKCHVLFLQTLKLQVKNKEIEAQLVEADIGDFEPHPEHEVSLNQLAWCEKNLLRTIEKVKEIKNEKLALEKGANNPLIFAVGSQQHQSLKNNPNIAKVPTNIFDEMLGEVKGKGKEVADHAFGNNQTMLYSGVPIVPKIPTMPSYYSLQHYLVKEALKLQHGESNSSFGNFTGENGDLITRDYLSKLSATFPESSIDNGKNASADAAFDNEKQPNLVLSLVNSAEATPVINPRASSPVLYDFLPSKPTRNPKFSATTASFSLVSGTCQIFGLQMDAHNFGPLHGVGEMSTLKISNTRPMVPTPYQPRPMLMLPRQYIRYHWTRMHEENKRKRTKGGGGEEGGAAVEMVELQRRKLTELKKERKQQWNFGEERKKEKRGLRNNAQSLCVILHKNAQSLCVIAHLNTKPRHILATSIKKIIIRIKLVINYNAQRFVRIFSTTSI